jgi:protein-S-isoprenylcysteine O-methyltransferase Ste14
VMNFGLAVRGVGIIVLLTAGLLLIGGRTSYWQAWLFGLVNCLLVLALSVWLADQAELIRDRMKPGPVTKAWDKILMAVFFPLALAVPVVASLDAGRFGWSAPFHVIIYPLCYAVYVASACMHLEAIRANRFYKSTVSIEPEEGQAVVDAGPYAVVRHPGYTGIIFMEIGIALVLGSLWALIPAGLVAALLVVRTVLEDTALRAELPGYDGYAERVRYRLLPGLW